LKKKIAKAEFTNATSDVRTLSGVMLENGEIESIQDLVKNARTDEYYFTLLEQTYDVETEGPYVRTKGYDHPENDPLLQLPKI
jgi:glutamate synthase domain-containing protein 1